MTVLKSVADSPEMVRVGDAWRLYDTSEYAGCLRQMKQLMAVTNPQVYSAMLSYEGDMILERCK